VRRVGTSGIALVAYLATVLLYPALHQHHHALHGDDHVHLDLATIFFAEPPIVEARAVDYQHNDFDADFASLDLTDVAEAGALPVDCSLAAYTLTECADTQAQHPHRFGDELLAHGKHPPSRARDPRHGLGSLEHLGTSFLAAKIQMLPPPLAPETRVAAAVVLASHSHAARITRDSRGPPASS
jgi:hypothetical protein